MVTSFGNTISDLTENSTPTSEDLFETSQLQSDNTFKSLKVTQTNLVKKRIKVVTDDYTVTAEDDIITCNDTSDDLILTLPTAIGITGISKTIKKLNSNAHNVLITPHGSETIDGAAGVNTLSTAYSKITIMSDGTNWLSI
jgi:hypothetical protein